MNRFFKRQLVPGMPWSTPGLIDGIMKMAEVLSELECKPGTVRWYDNDRRAIVFPSGGGGGIGNVIPVQLEVTAGTAADTGDDTTQCGYEYDVFAVDADTEVDDPLLEDVDPTDGHYHQRPTVGYMIAATFGYAHYESGALKLGFINEIPDAEACASI